MQARLTSRPLALVLLGTTLLASCIGPGLEPPSDGNQTASPRTPTGEGEPALDASAPGNFGNSDDDGRTDTTGGSGSGGSSGPTTTPPPTSTDPPDPNDPAPADPMGEADEDAGT
jgi:hypothetical protein